MLSKTLPDEKNVQPPTNAVLRKDDLLYQRRDLIQKSLRVYRLQDGADLAAQSAGYATPP